MKTVDLTESKPLKEFKFDKEIKMKIDVTEEQYKAFQNGESITLVPPKKEHVIVYESRCFMLDTYDLAPLSSGQNHKSLSHGRYRKTKDNAEHSLKRNQRANRLEALVEDLQGELGVGYYNIAINNVTEHYIVSDGSNHYKSIGIVYMKKETAEKVCELLNSEQYSLEG